MARKARQFKGKPKARIPNEWEPRPYQLPLLAYLADGGKRACVAWHRRAGKDSVALNWACIAALQRVGTYWHMLPQQSQARKVVWDGIDKTGRRMIDQAFPLAIRESTHSQDMKITLRNGSVWQLCGSDNYESLIGANPVGVIFSEWKVARPASWDYIRPILAENAGWAVFISTPFGHNHFYDLMEMARVNPAWFSQTLTINDTGAIPIDAIQAERDAGMLEEMIQQEFYCSFTGVLVGAYYGKLLEEAEHAGRLCSVPYDPALPVHTAWDIGVDDETAIWMIQVLRGGEIHVIDYMSGSGEGIQYYLGSLQARGYLWGTDYVPHDMEARSFVAGGRSAADMARAAGRKLCVIKAMPPLDRIQATRAILPRCWIDKAKCKDGLDALRQYHRRWDDDHKTFRTTPEHDWSCLHGETSVLTRHGTYQIMDLPNKGEVLTLCGWKQYENPRITKRNVPLVEVRFKDGFTVKCTPDHPFLTEHGWTYAKDLTSCTVIQSYSTHSHNTLMEDCTDYGLVTATIPVEGKSYTGMRGLVRLGSFLTRAISIIRTEIQAIIQYLTWNVFRQAFIFQRLRLEPIQNGCITSPKRRGLEPQSGIDPMQAGYGISAMLSGHKVGLNGSGKKDHVSSVGSSSQCLSEKAYHRSIVPQSAKPLRIDSVKVSLQRADVWCLSVPSAGHFSLENGAIVHNSHAADAIGHFAVGYEDLRAPVPQLRLPYLGDTSHGTWMGA